jgi:AmmeMemoRadiSam system protein B
VIPVGGFRPHFWWYLAMFDQLSGERIPAVAGAFYPSTDTGLRDLVEWCIAHPLGPGVVDTPSSGSNPTVAIAPHAGLRFSGPIAAHAHLALRGSKALIILGPNHRGVGSAMALSGSRSWQTPLGDVLVSAELQSFLRRRCTDLAVDDRGHTREHSIEVQLPFVLRCCPEGTPIVPISLSDVEWGSIEALGDAIGELLVAGDANLLATTDLSHYLPRVEAEYLDERTIDDVLSGDARLLDGDYRAGIARLCGRSAVVTAMVAASHAGLTEASLIARCTSADTGGPSDSVVGYAAIKFEKSQEQRGSRAT